MPNQSDVRQNPSVTACRSMPSRKRRFSRGQSMVEFALIAPVALVIMVVGIQYAIIGQAALAVSQGASALARYAAVNPGAFGTNGNGTVTVSGSPAANLLSPTILTGTNDGDLTVTISSVSAATGNPTTGTPSLGDRLTINISYDATSKLALPNPFLLGISFPTNLTSQDSQVYE
jgi:uncharacterized protein (UPF0333 family)